MESLTRGRVTILTMERIKNEKSPKVLKRDRQEINELNQDTTHFLKIPNLQRGLVYQYKF